MTDHSQRIGKLLPYISSMVQECAFFFITNRLTIFFTYSKTEECMRKNTCYIITSQNQAF